MANYIDRYTAVPGIKYHVINRRNGSTVSVCSTMKRASNKVDKHDLAYGGYAHRIIQYVNGVPTDKPCI